MQRLRSATFSIKDIHCGFSMHQKKYLLEVSTIIYGRGEEMFFNLPVSLGFGKISLSKFKYRDRATIIGNILDTIRREPKGKTKTSIMRDANLNFDQVNTYLQLLILHGIIKPTNPLNGQELGRYKLTSKGFGLLRDFEIWYLLFESSRRRPV